MRNGNEYWQVDPILYNDFYLQKFKSKPLLCMYSGNPET